uniref:Reverse transcriptase Ty1/copia-type domain-containing protein n=1 Tax=Cajanus cajan TaxID=3821 RepID=A0A151T7V0_CAJCA|nr:hypothetical protein KK1_017649 [Cajanus cajan]
MKIFKAYLGAYFHTKDLGVLKYFLGLEVAHNPGSLTDWVVLLVSWKIEKQSIVSRFSVGAEYRSMAATTCELKWLK